jgi:hypothetical protein
MIALSIFNYAIIAMTVFLMVGGKLFVFWKYLKQH